MNGSTKGGKRAPPDPPILADAKGGRRTKIEGKQREPAWDAGLMDEERTRCRIQSGVNSKQSILTIKRKETRSYLRVLIISDLPRTIVNSIQSSINRTSSIVKSSIQEKSLKSGDFSLFICIYAKKAVPLCPK